MARKIRFQSRFAKLKEKTEEELLAEEIEKRKKESLKNQLTELGEEIESRKLLTNKLLMGIKQSKVQQNQLNAFNVEFRKLMENNVIQDHAIYLNEGNEKKKLRYLKMKQGMLEKGHATEKEALQLKGMEKEILYQNMLSKLESFKIYRDLKEEYGERIKKYTEAMNKAMAKNLKGVGDLKLKTGQEKDKAQSTCKKSVHLHKIMSQEKARKLVKEECLKTSRQNMQLKETLDNILSEVSLTQESLKVFQDEEKKIYDIINITLNHLLNIVA